MACEADSNLDSDAATLAALDAFISTQRALLSRQLTDIDRLQTLKAELEPTPSSHNHQHHKHQKDILTHLTSTLTAASTLALSTHADLALKLPPALDWSAFARCDPAPVRALAVPTAQRAPVSHTSPPSELQTFVRHAARTMLEPRMRRYPRVPTPSPSASGDECDPINARRAREHAKIRELRDVVRRGGGSGLCMMSMGVIRTDVGEEAMRDDVQIDEEGEAGMGKRSWAGKGAKGVPRKGKHPPAGKHSRGKAVPAAYLHAGEGDGGDDGDGGGGGGGAAPSHATKNLGLVVAHAAAASSPQVDADADLEEDMPFVDYTRGTAHLNADEYPPPLAEAPPATKLNVKSKAKSKSKGAAKPKTKPKTKPKRAKKASYEYTDDEDEEGASETEYKDPSAFVPTITVYPSSSSGEEGAEDIDTLDAHMDLDDDMNVDSDGPAVRSKARPSKRKQKGKKMSVEDDSDDAASDGDADASIGTPTANTATKKTKTGAKPTKPKPKPATFNLPWSTAEQHHLEQLLEEIPEGVRFRWQQISRAMGGRRTPRQVASRVQKYFEKMKRCGLM